MVIKDIFTMFFIMTLSSSCVSVVEYQSLSSPTYHPQLSIKKQKYLGGLHYELNCFLNHSVENQFCSKIEKLFQNHGARPKIHEDLKHYLSIEVSIDGKAQYLSHQTSTWAHIKKTLAWSLYMCSFGILPVRDVKYFKTTMQIHPSLNNNPNQKVFYTRLQETYGIGFKALNFIENSIFRAASHKKLSDMTKKKMSEDVYLRILQFVINAQQEQDYRVALTVKKKDRI